MGIFRKKVKESAVSCSVVVLAAGSSTRMGQDKIMADVGGLPVIVRTLMAFQPLPEVSEIVVVTREELIPEIAGMCKAFSLDKVVRLVKGGSSRLESARIGTLEVRRDAPLIAIHDGARPFVPAAVISETIARAAQTGAAAPAIPMRDTVKVARDGLVEHTPDRETLFAVQTPQVFDGDLIRAALQKALDDGAAVTDDCSAVERLGMQVSLTAGDSRNFKLTDAWDLARAEALLTQEGSL